MSYLYLATPYSEYPGGQGAAFLLACEQTGLLIRAGVTAFSPIAHTHPIAMACGMDPLDHAIWLPADQPLMDAASGLILLKAESWEISYGMQKEREAFEAAGKPVFWMEPDIIPPELLPAG